MKKRPSLQEAIRGLLDDLPSVEEAYVLCLSPRDKVAALRLVGKGAEAMMNVSRQEILRRVLLSGCKRFALAHTHPSGFALPSKEDLMWTCHLGEESHRLGIELVDHVILSSEGSYSFASNGMLPQSDGQRLRKSSVRPLQFTK